MNTSNITNYKPSQSCWVFLRYSGGIEGTDSKSYTNHRRYYTYKQYLEFKGITEDDARKVVLYARVSTKIKG